MSSSVTAKRFRTPVPTNASQTTDDIRHGSHTYGTVEAALETAHAFADPTAIVVGMLSQFHGRMMDAVSVGVVR